MQTISVMSHEPYDVSIGAGLLQQLGTRTAAAVSGRRAVIVTDTHVWPLYGAPARDALCAAGFSVAEFVFPAGESQKNAATYLKLLDFLAAQNVTRSDVLIALGGGVVGDLCGFAAATYRRGMPFVQVPTTLLAMVDAAVGGKNGIDLPSGKNMAGTFHSPRFVLCDTDTLASLPSDIFRDGCAEIVKYAVLYDSALFAQLQAHGAAFPRQPVICRCIEHKRDAVRADEYDRGVRRLLNFGHTVGHALETLSQYTLSHGQAVAIGMCAVTRAAIANGECDDALLPQLIDLLEKFGLPTETDIPAQAWLAQICADKKWDGDRICLIVPATVGCCTCKYCSMQELQSWFKAGM